MNGAVPVVMLSHRAKEADVKRALNDINALDVVSNDAVLIRIENEKRDSNTQG
jgi:homoserine dehydrogenase